LELAFVSRRGTLREAITSFLVHQTDGVSNATLDDYSDRGRWLCARLGEDTPLEALTFERLERLIEREGPNGSGLMIVTIKKRLMFLRMCCRYAVQRGVAKEVPQLPLRKLRSDSRPRESFLTPEQFASFVVALPEGGRAQRFAVLAFWTGMHSSDLYRLPVEHLAPHEAFEVADDEHVTGKWLRTNTKNVRSKPIWLPMEPELRAWVLAWQRESWWRPGAYVTEGRVWALHRSFAAAADRAGVPRVAPIDLRRSFATMLTARGYADAYVRFALGHAGRFDPHTSRVQRPTTAERHYVQFVPALARH
jgi:integrase